MVAVNYIQKHCSKLLRLHSLIVDPVFKNKKKLGTGNKKQWQFIIISQALKLQGDFNKTVKFSNHLFGDEKISCAYKKKRYCYYNYLAIKIRFVK